MAKKKTKRDEKTAGEGPQKTQQKKKEQKMNIWQTSTIVLGFLLIVAVLLGATSTGNCPQATTGATNTTPVTAGSANLLSSDDAASKAIDFINNNLLQGGTTAELDYVGDSNGLYTINLTIQNQTSKVYVSRDAALLFPMVIDMTKPIEQPQQNPPDQQAPPSTNIPKSDKPVVELFVMSYCPYGTQIEKGMIPAIEALGDKVDFELKFVDYAMHGEKEVKENLRQYCIQKEFPDKYLDYLSCFLKEGDASACLQEVSLSEAVLDSCRTATDSAYNITALMNDKSSYKSGRFPQFNINEDENQKYGVRGSPTLVINGVTASSARDAQSLLGTICSAFSEAPEECSTDLSSYGSPSPGFGYSAGSGGSSGGCET